MIYLARSGHSKTGRLQGMLVCPTPAVVADDAAWERAIQWTMADFGLRNYPIFQTEILGVEDEGVVFAPLRCYTKDGSTILATHNKPCEMHPGAPDPRELLPSTTHVEWRWRARKPKKIGSERPSCELVEVPEVAEGRSLSTLSTRNRLQRLCELVEAERRLDWEARMERIAERYSENVEARQRELEHLQAATQERRKLWEEKTATRHTVERALLEETTKIAMQAGKVLDILGFRTTQTGNRRVVLRALLCANEYEPCEGEALGCKHDRQGSEEEALGDEPCVCVWETKGLGRILDSQAECFETAVDQFECTLQWLPRKDTKLQIRVQDLRTFWNNGGRRIAWNPISVLSTPKVEDLQELQRLLEEEEQNELVARRMELRQKQEGVGQQDCSTAGPHPTKVAKRRWKWTKVSISYRASQRQPSEVPQGQSFSYPPWERTANQTQRRRHPLGARFCKKKSRESGCSPT